MITGCATVSEKDCKQMNWSNYATESFDEADGITFNNLQAKANKACAHHGITVDYPELKKGFSNSTNLYCTTRGAWDVGMRGNVYLTSLCEPAQIERLELFYKQGSKNHELISFLKEVEEARERLSELRVKISRAQSQLPHKTGSEAASLKDDINDMEDEILEIKSLKELAINHATQLKFQARAYDDFYKEQLPVE